MLREFAIKQKGIKKPSAAPIKAMLINGAHNIGGQYIPSEAGVIPNADQGFGRVDVAAIVGPLGVNQQLLIQDEARALDTSEEDAVTAIVPAGAKSLKTTLVWTDPPGEGLQNDLDLIVTAGPRSELRQPICERCGLRSHEQCGASGMEPPAFWPIDHSGARFPRCPVPTAVRAYRSHSLERTQIWIKTRTHQAPIPVVNWLSHVLGAVIAPAVGVTSSMAMTVGTRRHVQVGEYHRADACSSPSATSRSLKRRDAARGRPRGSTLHCGSRRQIHRYAQNIS